MTVEDYFDMLALELRGQPYSKAEHRRRLTRILSNRSETAVERKHMNISAILRDEGFPFIDGYQPYGNYQALLARVVRERLALSPLLLRTVERTSGELPNGQEPWLKADPEAEVARPIPVVREPMRAYGAGFQPGATYDYPQRDAANRVLGELGERFVLELERRRLLRSGRDDLAKGVRWDSKELGDGAGYDIRSFETSGAEVLLEVKTTNHNSRFPFFVTQNELRVSEEASERYCVYRLFHFSRDPHFFRLPGALSASCSLEPQRYIARV